MPRPLRIQFPGAWYHVMNRGACRAELFRQPIDRLVFLDLLAKACSKTSMEVHAYCLMDNHFHLAVRTPDGNIDEAMQLLCGRYARYFNDKYGRDGALCRGRYRSILIDSDRYLLAVSRYIHRNPLAFWESELDEYPWSSYQEFRGYRPAPVWVDVRETLDMAGGRAKYATLVESPLPSEIDRLHDRQYLPAILGSKTFKESARKKGSDPFGC